MKESLVSVIIPTFKRPDTLARAIHCVLSQTYSNVEAVVVDDNDPETEGRKLTEEIMAQFSGHPKVRYIQHDHNRNGSAARNTGVKSSTAEFVAFLDDDDEILPNKIAKQMEVLLGRGDDWGACYSKYATKKTGMKQVISREHREGNLYVEALSRDFHIAAGSNLLVRRCYFDSINGFDESFRRNQDVEFLVRLLKKCKIAYSDTLGLIVNVHFNHNYFDEQDVINKFLERFDNQIKQLTADEQIRLYRKINQQRFFDYFRTKHDLKKCLIMILKKDITVNEATHVLWCRLMEYIKSVKG